MLQSYFAESVLSHSMKESGSPKKEEKEVKKASK